MSAQTCDLLIVGAGPAGMAAAIEAAQAGLDVVVVDEGSGPGGQIYRAVLAQSAQDAVLGADYAAGRALGEAFVQSGARHVQQASAFLIEKAGTDGFSVGVSTPDRARLWQARMVLIATGALERPFPIPGWTLPGVMSAGAAQSLLKQGGIVPEGPLVLAGTGPLLYLLAAQYARAGVKVAALLDTTPALNWLKALPYLPGFLASAYAWKGLGLLREALRSTRVIRGVNALAALGEGQLSGLRFCKGGYEMRMEARTLLLHQGVVPQVNLAMASGALHGWNADRLAFEPKLDPYGETNMPGLFIAGDSSGISGADVARKSGMIAALAIIARLRPDAVNAEALRAAQAMLAQAQRGRAFLDRLYRPADAFRIPADDVMICRCEEVRAGEIRALSRRGAPGPNQAKAFSRAGMGPCQGRLCGLTVCEIMAQASGKTPDEIGHVRLRPPVKPVTLAQWAAMNEAAD